MYVGPGEMFNNSVKRAIALSKEKNQVVMFNFNGVNCHVNETSDPVLVDRDYGYALRVGIENVGPGYQEIADQTIVELARKADEKRESKMAEFRERLRKETEEKKIVLEEQKASPQPNAIGHIRLKDQDAWDKYKINNIDTYGARCVSYAEDWALLMQNHIPIDATADIVEAKIAEIADETSNIADYDGITGYMFSAARAILKKCWVYGEQLSKYYSTK